MYNKCITYVRTVGSLLVVTLEVVVHVGSLLPMRFSYELLNVSIKHRLYLILAVLQRFRSDTLPLPITCSVLPSGGIVVELSPVRSLAADFPFCN